MPEKQLFYRCWCQTLWPVERGERCPRCGIVHIGAPFTRTPVAEGIVIEQIQVPGKPEVAMVDLEAIEPGTYLDGEFFYGNIDSPEYEAYLKAHGLYFEDEVG